jgi:hypothetical protein
MTQNKKKDKQEQFIIQPKTKHKTGLMQCIHEKSKQTKTKIETSDSCFG